MQPECLLEIPAVVLAPAGRRVDAYLLGRQQAAKGQVNGVKVGCHRRPVGNDSTVLASSRVPGTQRVPRLRADDFEYARIRCRIEAPACDWTRPERVREIARADRERRSRAALPVDERRREEPVGWLLRIALPGRRQSVWAYETFGKRRIPVVRKPYLPRAFQRREPPRCTRGGQERLGQTL